MGLDLKVPLPQFQGENKKNPPELGAEGKAFSYKQDLRKMIGLPFYPHSS
jgi:hypothetical protein